MPPNPQTPTKFFSCLLQIPIIFEFRISRSGKHRRSIQMIRPNAYSLDQEDPEVRLRRQQLLQESCRRQRIGLKLFRRLQQLHSRPRHQSLIAPPSVEALELDYSRLTAFLEADRSFFSPWNWSPNYAPLQDHRADTFTNFAGGNQRMMFLLGSFFSDDDHQVIR